mmetsp:Transcript_14065/g.52771  ORF Transcript_14065/g.52771 Transcript_14065/m.52771 type:complete len:235 (+) Transcript_14065:1950-2654(+)
MVASPPKKYPMESTTSGNLYVKKSLTASVSSSRMRSSESAEWRSTYGTSHCSSLAKTSAFKVSTKRFDPLRISHRWRFSMTSVTPTSTIDRPAVRVSSFMSSRSSQASLISQRCSRAKRTSIALHAIETAEPATMKDRGLSRRPGRSGWPKRTICAGAIRREKRFTMGMMEAYFLSLIFSSSGGSVDGPASSSSYKNRCICRTRRSWCRAWTSKRRGTSAFTNSGAMTSWNPSS